LRLDPLLHLKIAAAAVAPLLRSPRTSLWGLITIWIANETSRPRDINRLRHYLGDGIDDLRQWDELSQAEAAALNSRSAAVASMKLSRVSQEAQGFYHSGLPGATDIYEIVGRPTDRPGRLVIVDLQGLSDTAKQVTTALVSSEILRAASSKIDPTLLHRPRRSQQLSASRRACCK
jgi:hypothetical protein